MINPLYSFVLLSGSGTRNFFAWQQYKMVVPVKKECGHLCVENLEIQVQRKPLIMITLGPALFDNNNRLITLSGVNS